MKRWILFVAFFFSLYLMAPAQEKLSPYLGLKSNSTVTNLNTEIQNLLKDNGYNVIGEYNVAGKADMHVICFTSDDLIRICGVFEDRGALASVLKIGLRKDGAQTEISLLNPNYMFYAYFGEDYKIEAPNIKAIDEKIKSVLTTKYGNFTPFGGALTSNELEGYHYAVMMPYFEEPVSLEEYKSFEAGLDFIKGKLAVSKDVKLVYQQINAAKKTAVFGLALASAEKGEGVFLPIIGERHLAAMPYEIILQGNEVTMLHGRYRFALYWPELTMGTFTKIMSTPGDVEDAMLKVTAIE